MSTTIDETKLLRKAGYHTSYADDGVVCVHHEFLAVLRFHCREESAASRAIIKEIVRVVRTYGEALIRYDRNGSVEFIFQTENGRSASLRDSHNQDLPGFRVRGETRISHVVLGIDRDGIRLDGKFENGRTPLTVARRSLALFPHEAATDLREELQGILDAARERGELRFAHEDAVSQPTSYRPSVTYAGPSLTAPEDRYLSLPALSPEQAAEVRRLRIEKGLDQPPRRSARPGYG